MRPVEARTPACTLHLERKHGPKKKWEKITITANNPDVGLGKLGKHLPEGGKIAVWFTDGAAIIQANFKIKVSGHVVHPEKEVALPAMSGRHNLAICGIGYNAMVD